MSIDLGSRLPAYCTAMGRVLLAHLPAGELDAYLRSVKPIARTNRTEIAPKKLGAIIASIRERGYGVVDQELEIGLHLIAVPIADPAGRVTAALNVDAHAARVSIAEV